jgi:hypothetical protein
MVWTLHTSDHCGQACDTAGLADRFSEPAAVAAAVVLAAVTAVAVAVVSSKGASAAVRAPTNPFLPVIFCVNSCLRMHKYIPSGWYNLHLYLFIKKYQKYNN